jgi:hypothetical protein
VTIHLQTCTVTVEQKSKMVWIATGDYLGRNIFVKNRTHTSALKRWVETAFSKRMQQ